MMSFDFEFLLFSAVIFTGFFAAIHRFYTRARTGRISKIINGIQSYFFVLFAVLLIRSFIIQFHYVPTGSLEPTLLPGDLVATNQFAYGLRLPVLNRKVFSLGEPKMGDIVVFRSLDDSRMLVKRVVGLPGDHLEYKNKVLTVNGIQASQKLLGSSFDPESEGNIPVDEVQENLLGKNHAIFIQRGKNEMDFDVIVPRGHFFMMGDNRDNSADSRYFGFVPEKNLCGKAFAILGSWDKQRYWIRWKRIGQVL